MKTLFSVQDKIILITGASSGLGCHFAKTLARAGAKVALCARRLDRLKKIANEISHEGGVAIPFELDVTRILNITKVVSEIEDKLGSIDVLVNNAGIDARGNIFATGETDWASVIDTNLKGPVFVAQAVAAHMVKNKVMGSIINISSTAGISSYKGGNPSYLISKSGIAHFTNLLALELASSDIRANTLAPGVYRTEINDDLFNTDLSEAVKTRIPLSRFGDMEDLNGALFLLCSDASRYMTGEIIRVDGGLGIHKLL